MNEKVRGRVELFSHLATIGALGVIIWQFCISIDQTKLLRSQVFLSNSLSISQLGDRCMWNTPYGGEYDSYLTLLSLRDRKNGIDIKSREMALRQIKRVQDMYKTEVKDLYIKNLFAICKLGSNCTAIEPEYEFSAKNVIHHMYRYIWVERARAAYLLRNITSQQLKDDQLKWEDVFKALINNIGDTEWSMAVRKISLDTYSQLANFEPHDNDIFDFNGAIKHWDKNREKILKEKEK